MPEAPSTFSAAFRKETQRLLSMCRLPSGQVRVFKRAELLHFEQALEELAARVEAWEQQAIVSAQPPAAMPEALPELMSTCATEAATTPQPATAVCKPRLQLLQRRS